MNDKKPKILILLMSASLPFFRNQLEDCKNTWLSVLSKPEYKKLLSYYTERIEWAYYDTDKFGRFNLTLSEDKNRVSIDIDKRKVKRDENDKHHLICNLPCDGWTFNKTYNVLEYVTSSDYEFSDYDYVVRTNTSTYINILLLSYVLFREFNSALNSDKNSVDIYYSNKSNFSGNFSSNFKHEKSYCTEVMSLFFSETPEYGDIAMRGNCLILTNHQVKDILLPYGRPLLTSVSNGKDDNIIDDMSISGVLNCYYNNINYNNENAVENNVDIYYSNKSNFNINFKHNFNYLNHIFVLPQTWYKSTDTKHNFYHDYAPDGYGQDFDVENEQELRIFSTAIAIQVRSYYTQMGREVTEHTHYYELHNKLENYVFGPLIKHSNPDSLLEPLYNDILKYNENPCVWVQGNFPYIKLNELRKMMEEENGAKYDELVKALYINLPSDHQHYKYKEEHINHILNS